MLAVVCKKCGNAGLLCECPPEPDRGVFGQATPAAPDSKTIKPCPACETETASLRGDNVKVWVQCVSCLMCGPSYGLEDEFLGKRFADSPAAKKALAAWNAMPRRDDNNSDFLEVVAGMTGATQKLTTIVCEYVKKHTPAPRAAEEIDHLKPGDRVTLNGDNANGKIYWVLARAIDDLDGEDELWLTSSDSSFSLPRSSVVKYAPKERKLEETAT